MNVKCRILNLIERLKITINLIRSRFMENFFDSLREIFQPVWVIREHEISHITIFHINQIIQGYLCRFAFVVKNRSVNVGFS